MQDETQGIVLTEAPAVTPRTEAYEASAELELHPDEVVVVKRYEINGRTSEFVHTFRAYPEKGTILNIQRETGKRQVVNDEFTASGDADRIFSAAYDDLIVKAEGYRAGDRTATLEEIKARLPVAHKRAAIEAMLKHDVAPESGEELDGLDLNTGEEEMRVELTMNGGALKLVHFLRPLQPLSLAKLFRGARWRYREDNVMELHGADIYRRAEEVYDANVLRVQGYLWNGVPLSQAGEEWRRRVPLNHKASVIGAIRERLEGTEKN